MTTRYSIFPSVESGGSEDRVYFAEDFLARPARDHLAGEGDGVSREIGNSLAVSETSPASLAIDVGTGVARANGWRFEIFTSAEEVALDAADPSNPRIDRIVVRARLDSTNRDAIITKLTGTPAASPSPPALTRDSETYEISLAQILVGASVSSVTDSDITDERDDTDVCGWLRAQDSKLFNGKESDEFLQSGENFDMAGGVLHGHGGKQVVIDSNTTLNNTTHYGSILLVGDVTLTIDPQASTPYSGNHQFLVIATHANGCTVQAGAGVDLNDVTAGSLTIDQNGGFGFIRTGSDAWRSPNADVEAP